MQNQPESRNQERVFFTCPEVLPEHLQIPPMPFAVPDTTLNLIDSLQLIVKHSSASHIDLNTGLLVKNEDNQRLWDLLCEVTDETTDSEAKRERYRELYLQATRTPKKFQLLMDLTSACILLQKVRHLVLMKHEKLPDEKKLVILSKKPEALLALMLR